MRLPLWMLFATLLVLPACNQNEPRSTQAAAERTNAEEQMKNDRDAYVKSVKASLAEFDQKFDGLDERANAMSGETKTNFKIAIDGLRDQRKTVASKLDDLEKVDIQSWMPLKGEVDSAMAGLDRAYMQISDTYEKAPATSTNPKAKSY